MSFLRDSETSIAPAATELEQQFAAALAERDELLKQQAASAEILKVISRSGFDLDSVMNTLASSAAELCGTDLCGLFLRDGAFLSLRGWSDLGALGARVADTLTKLRIPVDRDSHIGRAVLDGTIANIPDFDQDSSTQVMTYQQSLGFKAMLMVPLMREGRGVGVFGLCRNRAGEFSQRQIELVQTFADQAIIAIENTRLFNETKEALERQTATADILRVIASSPDDVQPVFEAIAERSKRLVDARSTTVFRLVDGVMYLKAFTPTNPAADAALAASFPRKLSEQPWGKDIANGVIFRLTDTEADPSSRDLARLRGYRSMLFLPLLRDGVPIGLIGVTRPEPGSFADHHVQLLQTFADQAVIAIQNARMFNETREALERQTATADILKVIASSPDDVQPVFDAIAERSNRLLDGYATIVLSIADGLVHLAAFTPTTPSADAALQVFYPRPLSKFGWGEAILSGTTYQITDTEADLATSPAALKMTRLRGWRSGLYVPLLHDRKAIGVICVTRVEAGCFADHYVELLKTFADQAVIAISNVDLFQKVQERTRDLSEALQQQTATADVLKVISRSTFDLQTVLETLVKSAVELSGGSRGSIFLREGDVFPLKAASSTTPEFLKFWADNPPRAGRGSATSRVIASGKVEIIPDVLDDPEMQMPAGSLVRIRATLGVPMLRDNKVEGVLVLTRPEPGPFTKSQIDLVQTFADQAVIAVENVRLFDETQARTRELAASLDELRAAQDRLVQTEKLASLGQLTAGIAHEIKNPLNFVNNFSALSAELVEELDEALAPVALDQKTRDDVGELTALLKSNLEKVVQHGKRADSIVKNMLLHSREGGGEHRPADINALVDESLNLAYHGARAERPGFNITLQRELAPDAGMVELYPQEITRVLLNLISNGFYAAGKRKEANGDDFEPVLSATTKGFDNRVEIRIHDNGTGIPLEVREKMFNPFFTTKPAGEGTGLGLSMSHDIIVKQHGGKIDVATEPGVFTEFIITLPRKAVAQGHSGGTH